jgi:hypothetical protein
MKTTHEHTHKINSHGHNKIYKPKKDHRPSKPKEDNYDKQTRSAIEFEQEHNIPTYLESEEA